MEKILITSRLYLRRFSSEDSAYFFALNEDPEVMRYTGDVPFTDEAAARAFLDRYDHYQHFGYGRWAVIRQSDEAYLGWCGLKYTPEIGETDLGFRFFRKYWDKGYATESAKACLRLGFEHFNLNQIVGRAYPGNKASHRVLEKIGMQFLEERKEDKEHWVVYHINNNGG